MGEVETERVQMNDRITESNTPNEPWEAAPEVDKLDDPEDCPPELEEVTKEELDVERLIAKASAEVPKEAKSDTSSLLNADDIHLEDIKS